MDLALLQERLGYHFGDRRILLQALTHRSYGHEYFSDQPIALRDNERLEFLGDAILDVVISDILLESYPQASEGHLSKMRAAVVNEKTLAQLALSLKLQDSLRLGKGEELTGGRQKASILSSGLEAVFAAIYLDGGFQAVYPAVRHLLSPFFEGSRDLTSFYDHKTQLQEMLQARHRTSPNYVLRNTTGPDHAKVFEVEVRFKNDILGRAFGNSKKEAEQNAAKIAIESLAF